MPAVVNCFLNSIKLVGGPANAIEMDRFLQPLTLRALLMARKITSNSLGFLSSLVRPQELSEIPEASSQTSIKLPRVSFRYWLTVMVSMVSITGFPAACAQISQR